VFGKVDAADDFDDAPDMTDVPKGAAAEFENMEDDDVPAEESRYAMLSDWQYVVQSMQFIHSDGVQIWNDKQLLAAREGAIIPL
jgi:hypothetical protein